MVALSPAVSPVVSLSPAVSPVLSESMFGVVVRVKFSLVIQPLDDVVELVQRRVVVDFDASDCFDENDFGVSHLTTGHIVRTLVDRAFHLCLLFDAVGETMLGVQGVSIKVQDISFAFLSHLSQSVRGTRVCRQI